MTLNEPIPSDSAVVRSGHSPMERETERARSPIEKLREFQDLLIRRQEMYEILNGATTIPDLETMATQSTADLTALLAARRVAPLEGGSRQFSFLELGPRDDELDGLVAMQNILHGIFDEMYGRQALGEYQDRLPYNPHAQTHDEYSDEQYAYARDVADKRCAEDCPSAEELVARSYGDRQYQRWIAQRRPNRQA